MMASSKLESTDARNKLEDLSGVVLKPGDNPYDALIQACNNDAKEIQTLYSVHRVNRNAQQKAKFLAEDFKELIIDPFLLRLENPSIEPGFKDPRHCLVFWARPPDHIVRLATHVQNLLRAASPNLWLLPPSRMHMTTLEVAHSLTPPEIASLVGPLRASLAEITGYPSAHRARLVRPMVSYDLSALALSFLPAAGEHGGPTSPPPARPAPGESGGFDYGEGEGWAAVEDENDERRTAGGSGAAGTASRGDAYSYHHLRRDVFDLISTTGVPVASRYVVPSAHITLARYLVQGDHGTAAERGAWVAHIDRVNAWLEREVWAWDGEGEGLKAQHDFDGTPLVRPFVGEWIVGHERGLDARCGALWYGGGRTIMLGEGF